MQGNINFDIVTDIAVIGAGPGGCATSLFLSKAGINHTLFDKAIFPRDKVCWDAISGKAIAVFNQLDPSILNGIKRDESAFLGSWGVTFFAPNGKPLEVPFKMTLEEQVDAPGFIAKRIDFDNYLVEQLDHKTADIHLGAFVKNVENTKNGVEFGF